MRCPSCGHHSSRVVDSRPSPEASEIRRRRACESCQARFTTYERGELSLPVVVKRDGRREPFDSEKLFHSLQVACRKRPVSTDALEGLVERLGVEATAEGSREISTRELGALAMQALRGLDEVAYARFASVYLQFTTLSDFSRLASKTEPGAESTSLAQPLSPGPKELL